VNKNIHQITNPLALITGATHGLGLYLAKSFWQKGYDLILVSKNDRLFDTLIEEFQEKINKQSVHLFACDFANSAEVDSLIKELLKRFSHLDVLINNAAIQGPIGQSDSIWENDPNSWRETIQVDLLAPVEISSRLISLLTNSKSPGRGSIINLSGGGATGPRPNFSAYATAKAGLVRFSETLADEVMSLGIRVNCIAPGAMNTSMMEEVLLKGPDSAGTKEFEIAKKILASGGTSMERVAELALFLASADSLGVTGRLISAVWDNWSELSNNLSKLATSDLFTLRRISGRDRGMAWADL
jgi:NAD(P)-dependent dehydrogenase (short-subunit alcohol dehydrogenase family)